MREAQLRTWYFEIKTYAQVLVSVRVYTYVSVVVCLVNTPVITQNLLFVVLLIHTLVITQIHTFMMSLTPCEADAERYKSTAQKYLW